MKKILTALAASMACSAFAAGFYDGIYLWGKVANKDGYLSVHQNGGSMIATMYWNYSPSTPVTLGSLDVSELDTFDLLSGTITGNRATLTGTRWFRACNTSYDLVFNNDSTVTITHTSTSNIPELDVAAFNCQPVFNAVGSVWKLSKVF